MKYRVQWPDGDHYEEDGKSVFSKKKAEAVIRQLSGTIAGDARVVLVESSSCGNL